MKKKSILPVLTVLVILLLAGVGFGIIYPRYSYSDEYYDLQEYFGITQNGQVAIVLGDELIEEKALLRDGTYYLDLDTIHTYFNERFYLDDSVETSALLIYTTTEKSYRVAENSAVITTEDDTEQSDHIIMFYEDDICYVAADYVKRFTDMTYETYASPDRMQIDNVWPGKTVGVAKKDTQVRVRGGVKSEILTDIEKGTEVTVLEELDNWYKVKTQDAIIGYMPKRHLKDIYSYVEDRISTVEKVYYPARETQERISMGWHQVLSYAANDNIASLVEESDINVISPTWFLLNGNTGSYVCNASENYVNYAHGKGLDVWAVIDNFNMECDLYEVLKSTAQRDELISSLMADCKQYKIDGINVDFEQVSPGNADNYIQFIRELSVACHRNELVLSVDNYVPTDYTFFYNREEQGRFVDYVVIMGYDEHTGGSSEAGSVSSIEFVKKGIEDTLEKVEKDKVINGIPFYSRGWSTKSGEVSAKTLAMASQQKFVSDHGITLSWDEKTGQYYGKNTMDGVVYEIWMENAESLKVKLDCMDEYSIAGVAQWKLGLETKDVWEAIGEYLH